MMVHVGLLLILLPLVACERRVVMEAAAKDRLKGWAVSDELSLSHKVELSFMVKQKNVDRLYDMVKRVSDPRSKEYGLHLSLVETEQLAAPKTEDVAVVVNYLASVGAEARVENGGSVVTATVSLEKAEMLLKTKYARLVHAKTGRVAHRIVEKDYSLPESVAAAVDFVTPTVHIPPAGKALRPIFEKKNFFESDSEEDLEEGLRIGTTSNTPKSLRTLYNISLDLVTSEKENGLAVTAFLEQYYDVSDLILYWATYCDGITCGNGELPPLVGDATAGPAGVESMLDIETVTGVAAGVNSSFWGFSGRSPDNAENEPFTKWLNVLSNTTNPPSIFSTSYGEDESSWSEVAADRLNQEFAKAAVRGISLLFASGDEGANCEDATVFAPETPASSPFVTAVGGTTGRPEIAVGLSTGGFSNYWGQTEYQKDLVDAYLGDSQFNPTAQGISFNASGRAFPDISAQATDFCVTPFGCTIAGTSCASPTAAAIFSLLNDLRLQQNKSPLGFLNYFIYQNPDAFNDITDGSSSGCRPRDGSLQQIGWPAAPGWDAVTGVGTPNYAKLKDAVMKLP